MNIQEFQSGKNISQTLNNQETLNNNQKPKVQSLLNLNINNSGGLNCPELMTISTKGSMATIATLSGLIPQGITTPISLKNKNNLCS